MKLLNKDGSEIDVDAQWLYDRAPLAAKVPCAHVRLRNTDRRLPCAWPECRGERDEIHLVDTKASTAASWVGDARPALPPPPLCYRARIFVIAFADAEVGFWEWEQR